MNVIYFCGVAFLIKKPEKYGQDIGLQLLLEKWYDHIVFSGKWGGGGSGS